MNTIANALVLTIAATEETTFDPNSVTPGVWGFIMTAVFAAGVILLGVNLVRRLRRSTYRAEIREQLETEAAEAAGSAADERGRDA